MLFFESTLNREDNVCFEFTLNREHLCMNDNNRSGRKVLVADDDEDNRVMLTFILEEEGWQVTEASNGKEALEKALEQPLDILVLDNRMPDLTGAEIYQALRQRGLKTPVILVTAYGDLKDLAVSLGISYFLNKPFEIPELLTMLESIYQRSKSVYEKTQSG